MRTLFLLLCASLLLAVPAPAQQLRTIQPGMSSAEVRSIFGPPASVREMGEWSYFYYLNGCPRRCGSDDVVFLQADTVVAAVLRARHRRFAGPAAATALREATELPPVEGQRAAPRGRQPAQPGQPGIRLDPPAPREGAARRQAPTDLGTIRGREPAPAAPVAADTVAAPLMADTLMADTALDRQRQLREQRVEPRTIRGDTLAPPAEGAMDPRRQQREQRIEPRTVRPRPQAPPPPPAPAPPPRRPES